MRGIFECRVRSLAELVKLQFVYVHVFGHALGQWCGRRNDFVHGCISVDERGKIASPSTVAATWNQASTRLAERLPRERFQSFAAKQS